MESQSGTGFAADSAARFQDALANAAQAGDGASAAPHPTTSALIDPAPATSAMDSAAHGQLGMAGDFLKGVGEGAWDGAKGMVQGVAGLAQGAYSLATSADARQQAVNTVVQDAKAVGQFAQTAVTDPGKVAGQVSNAASGAWNQVSTAYRQTAAQGHGAEFIGKAFGQGAVLVGTAMIPGGAEAEAAGLVGDAGRVAQVAGGLGKAGEVGADVGRVSEAGAGVARIGNLAGAASGAGKAADVTAASTGEAASAGEGAAATADATPEGARGPSSKREFDPDKAGGPVEPRSLDNVNITHEGVDQVQAHIDRFGQDPFNDAMMARQRAIADGKLEPTIEDKAFHGHELDEYQRYQNMGYRTGLPEGEDAQRELWNNAHTAALEDYSMSEIAKDAATGQMRSTLYHPSCDPRVLPEDWTPPSGHPFNK